MKAKWAPDIRKHVIVEGPDGSGKSTLIEQLRLAIDIDVHAKASHSVDGPVDYLGKWVDTDMDTLRMPWLRPFIYDRHPVISEPIYARLVRQQPPQYPFEIDEFLTGVREVMYDTCIVVWCLPDLQTVSNNVANNYQDQMPGVIANIGKLHQAYMTAMFRWRGPKRQYNYNRHDLNWFIDNLQGMLKK